MSHKYYQRLWTKAQDNLQKTLLNDSKLKDGGPIANLITAKWLIGHLFMNYVGIVNRLDECYDQMLHPQKREVIGRLLDMSLGRLLEIKAELVRIESDDYCFFDNVLIELRLTHQDMEIKVPKYFMRDRQEVQKHRRKLMKQVYDEAKREEFKREYLKKIPEEDRAKEWKIFLRKEELQRIEREKFEEQQRKMNAETVVKVDSLEKLRRNLHKKESEQSNLNKAERANAIALIQRHERARQGRIRSITTYRYKIYNKRRTGNKEDINMKVPEDVGFKAAKTIQTHWRRHKKRLKKVKEDELVNSILGITVPSYRSKEIYEKLNDIAALRKKLQENNEKEYIEVKKAVKERIEKLYTMQMEDDIVDEIRAWFMWFFDKTNFFPDYPPENPVIPTGEVFGVPKKLGSDFIAKAFPYRKGKISPKSLPKSSLALALSGLTAMGGTALVVAGHWVTPQEFLICQKELEKRKKSGGNEKKGKDEKKKEEAKKNKEEPGFQLKDSSYLVPLTKANKDYRDDWMDRDESKNHEQKYLIDIIKVEKFYELSMEVRKIIDKMMAVELENLKFALELDKNPKKKRKKKKPKKQKKQNKKKRKKKEKVDPTGNRTLDDLFMELFKNGIIKDYQEVYLKDFLGERSFSAFDYRERDIDWPPSTKDIIDVVLQLCILPLGSTKIHQLSPLIKSVCLIGTEGSGKELLSRIICSETASVMFDLSPQNIAGKYQGKDGLKTLKHLIEKMSRALQPSVIFIEGAEKAFYKKVPKAEKDLQPKKIAKMLKDIVKGIKPEDQVLLLGISHQPWEAKKNAFLKVYQKLIMMPKMDYSSYYRVWQSLLTAYHTIPRSFDYSCLAKVSDGYSTKAIMDAVKNVMTAQRISVSKIKPYEHTEFLEELMKIKPIPQKVIDKCWKFYSKTEMQKNRKKRLEELKEAREKTRKPKASNL